MENCIKEIFKLLNEGNKNIKGSVWGFKPQRSPFLHRYNLSDPQSSAGLKLTRSQV